MTTASAARETRYDDAFYRDILEGLAIHSGSPLQRDVLTALSRHNAPELGRALNKNQMASKLWLADALAQSAAGCRLARVLILGGWVGVLAAVLLHDRRLAIDSVESLDIDPSCAPVAEAVNATHVSAGRFRATTADMRTIDYAGGGARFDLVINTSSEHLADFPGWYARVPEGQLLALQSNDYFACAEHVSSVHTLAEFRALAPMRAPLFEGERAMRRYVRFMLIGRK